MGGDIGRNVFYIPLDQRQKQLEQIPWVESASAMRFAPNRVKIEIHERTPVAFARIGSKILLVDAGGVLMELSSKKKYSFPVIVGMNSGEPLSTRAPRMKIYNQLVRELDSGGGRYSQDLSEVDLSDPEDVKVLTNDPDGEVLVHLGSGNYLQRFKIYVAHLREWREQFAKLESVDLRYDRQIIVNPDLGGAARRPALSAAAAKAAIAAGVKPAALVNRELVKPSAQHDSVSKPLEHATVVPTPSAGSGQALPQKTRKDGAPRFVVISGKHRVRQSHWRKSAAVSKRPVVNASKSTTIKSSKPSPTPVPQKPSPAILKGQAAH
jgi:cell division protein FtsQ